MAYLGKTPSQAVRSRYYFTATGGETSLSGADDNTNTLTFTDGNYVDVALNGVTLVAGTDYNTTTANTIGGLTALAASDVVEVVVYDTFSVFGGNVIGDFTLTNGTFTQNGLAFPTADGSSGQFLKTNGSGSLSFDTVSTDLVSDTTPQLGGDLQSNGNDVVFADSDKAIFGTGNDLQIYHDGSNSIIAEASTGSLKIQGSDLYLTDDDGTNMLYAANNGGVTLYQGGGARLATTSTGVDVTGDLSVSGSISGAGKVLQVVQTVKSNTFSTSSTSWVDITGLSASITPSSTSSKIMVEFHIGAHTPSVASSIKYKIVRGTTDIGVGDSGNGDQATAAVTVDATRGETASMTYLDSPATTSATTYKIQMEVGGGTVDINKRSSVYGTISTITLTEIGA